MGRRLHILGLRAWRFAPGAPAGGCDSGDLRLATAGMRGFAAAIPAVREHPMRLSLYSEPGGVSTDAGNRVVYDLARDAAHFGAARVDGHALRFELEDEPVAGVLLSTPVELDPATAWLVRCDRVDFPPGGVAYRHTHPGPGIRCLLAGRIRIASGGEEHDYGPLEAWFESGPEPVFAAASETSETSFVRVMLLPREWAGRRTIRYVDPADAERPKTQRARVFFDEPIEL